MTEDHERDHILEVETEKTQKEIDEEIKRKKEKQRFLDDVGVLTAMVSITLIAVLVVLIKVLIVHSEVGKIQNRQTDRNYQLLTISAVSTLSIWIILYTET